MKTYYNNDYPVSIGKTRFIITYTGFGLNIIFKTDIDEISEECAKSYFKKFYPSAKFVSIKEKNNDNSVSEI